jgi:uncharacterized membrane-anchored protein YitT (DUF2179 family)
VNKYSEIKTSQGIFILDALVVLSFLMVGSTIKNERTTSASSIKIPCDVLISEYLFTIFAMNINLGVDNFVINSLFGGAVIGIGAGLVISTGSTLVGVFIHNFRND